MALMEEFIPGRGENLHDYLIPTVGDMPRIESILIEDAAPHGPFGAKGIGEQALIPTAPAILNAIHHATGVRLRRAPATPDRVRAAILRARRLAHEPNRRTPSSEPSTEADGRHGALRCLSGAVLHRPGMTGACDRYANVDGSSSASIRCLLDRTHRGGGGVVPFLGPRWDGQLVARRHLRHRDRRGHDLSRLQARAFHRLLRGRRRGHGHGRHRGHLQLLRRQGEDRHRPPSRARAAPVRAQRRAGRPRHDRRIRLADALARRRPAPDRRPQEGGPRHLRHAARLATASRSSSTVDGGATVVVQAGKRADRQRRRARSACGSAAARPPSACSPSNGSARSTRWWSSTTTSPASSPSTRPAAFSMAADRHPHEGPPLDARPLFPGRRARARLGRHRHRRPAGDPGAVRTRSTPGLASRC